MRSLKDIIDNSPIALRPMIRKHAVTGAMSGFVYE